MASSSDTYDTLIGLRDKLTRLNGAITPEAIDKLDITNPHMDWGKLEIAAFKFGE